MKGFHIDTTCVLCGACVPACPEKVILEGEQVYVIRDPGCTECGDCLHVCPVDAIIVPEDESETA